jgi:hypothetical protein
VLIARVPGAMLMSVKIRTALERDSRSATASFASEASARPNQLASMASSRGSVSLNNQYDGRALKHVPLIPAHAGIQGNKRWSSRPLGPRFRGDERR